MSGAITNHWLTSAAKHLSPNCDQRPANVDLDLLVIHNISLPPGEFGGDQIQQFFCNQLDCNSHPYFDQIRDLKVSAHILIKRDGSIIQFVPFNQRAWHAGQSNYCGRQACNDFSIGIEMEGTDNIPYEQVQYSSLVSLTQQLLEAYPSLSPNAIVGHSDIAPERKTDPGPAFDWQHFRNLLQSSQS